MFAAFWNVFRVPDLRNKVLFTLALLAVYRIGFYVPVPGVDQTELTRHFKGLKGGGGGLEQLTEYFSMFTGGNLQQSTIFGLGIMPYISASIIFQLLGTVVPSLEKLRREGQMGQKKIQEYTLCNRRHLSHPGRVLAQVHSGFKPRLRRIQRRVGELLADDGLLVRRPLRNDGRHHVPHVAR
jgi:hypothetical protein